MRTAADGLSALAQIQREVPDILVSDLHMPGMSGFELLSMVRRQFPSIRAIAMSAFSADEIPSDVAADAFFQKGRGFGDLLMILESLPPPDRLAQQPAAATGPGWIPGSVTRCAMSMLRETLILCRSTLGSAHWRSCKWY